MSSSGHPFDRLTPQAVLDALDACGLRGDGRLLQLNSYENRVFQVCLEDGGVVVAKFYRPERWSDAQIAEEHAFAADLVAAEVPVVAPLRLAPVHGPAGATLATVQIEGQDFRVAAYPRRSGHGPELDDAGTLRWLGRFIGRLHAVGEQRPFTQRRTLDAATFGHSAVRRLLALDAVPPAQLPAWRDAAERALVLVDAALAACPAQALRIHGDCHPGNILWRDPQAGASGPDQGPHLVDLDDAVMGPAVQDLWMLLSGEPEAMAAQLAAVLQGYRQFRRFDLRELALVEPLRTLRMLHHSAWLAERWCDPAFPAAFPWFGNAGYWGQQAQQLREQIDAMGQPPLDPFALDLFD
ncbi:serine/threonine protein kinase [Aquabacterium sp. OR-4]|uniref:serine/threonine protein kinase n=1 Tax=Aquabacterium sp. OR-4 TaxID=2978127 RepID=UPI0028C85F9C|nr:serine/threonine protein kinase [Aquabacterium sp. OR-4]MDT7837631.1 serine/threonine protein kinase [Aquabacterium sp. OR-4]